MGDVGAPYGRYVGREPWLVLWLGLEQEQAEIRVGRFRRKSMQSGRLAHTDSSQSQAELDLGKVAHRQL